METVIEILEQRVNILESRWKAHLVLRAKEAVSQYELDEVMLALLDAKLELARELEERR